MLDAVRLKTFLASKHYCQNSLGLLFANRQGRPFSANKLREKVPRFHGVATAYQLDQERD